MSEIMAISRLRMGTDGDGITTLVAFHGCPLACKYCINPGCKWEGTVPAEFTPKELVKILAIDEPYFLMTGGGVTFGGGEPLLHADYIHEVCRVMSRKWRRTIETSLNVSYTDIKKIINDIDYWIVDIKDMDQEIYQSYTGTSNRAIRYNLRKLIEEVGVENVHVRVPLIPGYNTQENVEESIRWLKSRFGEALKIETLVYDI